MEEFNLFKLNQSFLSLSWVLTKNIDLEIALSSVSGFVIGDISHVIGSPLQGLSGLESSLVDDLLDADVVSEDGLVPVHEGRAVGGSNPQVT